MHTWSRRGFLSLGLGVATAAAAGCEGTAKLPLPRESVDTTIDFLTFTDGPEEAVFQDLCDTFRDESGIRVKMEVIPYADMAGTLRSRIERGVQPDVARVVQAAPLASSLLDLRQYEPTRFQHPFLPEFDGVIHDGNRIVAAPAEVTVTALFVNRDLFRRAGVTVPAAPWDGWDAMMADARKVKAAVTSEYAFLMDVSGTRFASLLSSYGTTYYTPEGDAAALDVDVATRAIERFAQMHEDGGMPVALFTGAGGRYKSGAEVFAAGQAPVYLAGTWQVAAFADSLTFDWTVVRNVVQQRTGAFPGGTFWVALEHGKQQQAARFVAYLASAGVQMKLAERANHVPTRRDVRAAGVQYGVRGDEMALLADELDRVPPDAWGTAFARGMEATAATAQDELEKLLRGTATPDGVAAEVRAAAEANAG